jgi:putative transposase
MGRPPRPIDDDLVYHVANRGNDRQIVFHDDLDHRAFLESLTRTKKRYPFRLFGYCLMSNHFHLLLRPEAGVRISRVMQSLTVAHTARYHKRYRSVGHVWQGRFRSPVVQDDGHLWTVLHYIEANPLRAGMVSDPDDYPWSSYLAHALGRDDPLVTPLADWCDLGDDESARRSVWRSRVLSALPDDRLGSVRESLRTGRPFGSSEWASARQQSLRPGWQRRPRGRPRKVEKQI